MCCIIRHKHWPPSNQFMYVELINQVKYSIKKRKKKNIEENDILYDLAGRLNNNNKIEEKNNFVLNILSIGRIDIQEHFMMRARFIFV